MTDYVILKATDAYRFNIEVASHAVTSVTSTLEYKGSCLYMPSPVGDSRRVFLAIDRMDATEEETDWFLAHLAGYLEAELLSSDGTPYFENKPESDLSFLESLPAPEAECSPIKLCFTVDGADGIRSIANKLNGYFYRYGYEVNPEPDGLTVYLATNSYLDIFVSEDGARVSGEIDCTYAGAGVYAEAADLLESAARDIGFGISFIENPNVTYTIDHDFDKLRREFYNPIKQQLAFAYMDDRDGLQAYFSWGTDAFETEYHRGTLVSSIGRYDFDRLKDEIRRYGFAYVCDHRLLTRNTPSISADADYKEVLNLMWNTSVGGRNKYYTEVEKEVLTHCFSMLEDTYKLDPFAQFPLAIYQRIGAMLGRECMSFTHIHEYGAHYEPGYLSEDVYYGFGHYLRRFKLPGTLSRDEKTHGYDVVFFDETPDGLTLECEIIYGYTGDGSESMLGDNFAKGSYCDIESFDIGGSSFVRYIESELQGSWRAEAEVYIKDELCRFAALSRDRDGVRILYDALRGAMSVEDWYDEVVREEAADLHANGATFCTSGVLDPVGEYSMNFPYSVGSFDIPTVINEKAKQPTEREQAESFLMDMFRNLIDIDGVDDTYDYPDTNEEYNEEYNGEYNDE